MIVSESRSSISWLNRTRQRRFFLKSSSTLKYAIRQPQAAKSSGGRSSVELVPEQEADFLKHVIRIGAVRDERQHVGVQPLLILEKQPQEHASLVLLGKIVVFPDSRHLMAMLSRHKLVLESHVSPRQRPAPP